MTSPAPLESCTIIVTRPREQADKLIELLEDAGASTVRFPVIEILPADDQKSLLRQASTLDAYDYAIFISRNAVTYGISLIWQARGTGNWPPATEIVAIGKGTRDELEHYDLQTAVFPAGVPNSENLLAVPEMDQVHGKKVLIFRGNGGREKLTEGLRKRGAIVDYFECYQRRKPVLEADMLAQIWNDGRQHGIVVTSCEGLRNLYEMISMQDRAMVNSTPLFVISPAMVELSLELGHALEPVLMPSAAHEDVLQSVIAYFSNKPV